MPPAVPAATASDPSLFAADGICPLPEQLRKKILNLEYVDMAELRPESWLFHSDTDSATPLQGLFQRRKEPVTDLAVWIQCYASLTSVLVEKYPQYTKHFLAYMATIATGYKRFKGLCWAAYDAAYRQKAARTKSLLWGNVDQYLYTVWFTKAPHAPIASAASTQWTPARTYPFPFLGNCFPPNSKCKPAAMESTPTASRAHAHQTGPRTMRPLQRSRRASLCLQPLQVLPYLQIKRWRSSCVLVPPPLQKTPAKPQLATTKVYEAVSQQSNNS